jgi:HAE1 family hydrophobic/amphiphilic exporter-1
MMGVISFLHLPIGFLPKIGYPQLTVITVYENSSPEEIESQITQPIEEVVSTMRGVRQVSSKSRDDVSVITLKFNWGSNMSYAALNLREKLDNIRYSLPENSGRPNIAHLDPSEDPVMYIALTNASNNITDLQEATENFIKPRLQQLEGVAAADIIGDREREIKITLDENLIKSLNLDISNIRNKIQYSNFSISGGNIHEGHYKYNIKIVGEYQNIKDIGYTPIGYLPDNRTIYLKDIAIISDDYKDPKSITRLNNKNALALLIRKEANSNTVKVCKSIRKELKNIRKDYPNVKFHIATDQSTFINESIISVLEAIIIGGFLAFFILILFLKDMKSPLNIALVIPISILTTFIFMYFNRISLNIISLSGLALGVGMLVDNSIVVSENIFRHQKENKDLKTAAYEGTKEVSLAIVASTFTTLAVFLPIIYVKGVASALFKQQALTVTFSLLSSLFVSLTLLPLIASLSTFKVREKKSHNKFQKIIFLILKIIFSPFLILKFIFTKIAVFIIHILYKLSLFFQKHFDKFSKQYGIFLRYSLKHKSMIIIIFLLLLCLSIGGLFTRDKEFFPTFEQHQFTIHIKSEAGTPLEKTNLITKKIESILSKDERISGYFTSVGKSTEDRLSYYLENTSSENLAEIKVNIKKEFSSAEIIADYGSVFRDFPAVLTFRVGDNILASVLDYENSGLKLVFEGNDFKVMKKTALKLKKSILQNKNFTNIHTNFDSELPMIQLTVNRENATYYQVPIKTISRLIRMNVSGDKVSEFREFDKTFDITLKIDDQQTLDNLLNQMIKSPVNNIPLRLLVKVKRSKQLEEIERKNQNRRLTISFDYKGKLSKTLKKLQQLIDKTQQTKIRVSVEGINNEIQNSLHSLSYALFFAIVLIYMILASQFESLKLPFIVMFVVPMGIIGVSLALVLTGTSINMMSTLGMIVLAGIIVNDAILLVDYTNQLRKKGFSAYDAIVKSSKTRLRPILMTTFTTVLGLFPLALGIGSGSELQSAMAISVIGGILASTFLTLILIPILYLIFEK